MPSGLENFEDYTNVIAVALSDTKGNRSLDNSVAWGLISVMHGHGHWTQSNSIRRGLQIRVCQGSLAESPTKDQSLVGDFCKRILSDKTQLNKLLQQNQGVFIYAHTRVTMEQYNGAYT